MTDSKLTSPYFSQTFLLTNAERAFHRVLYEAAHPHLLICPKVRLADLVTCNDESWELGFGAPIKGKHLDFVLVHPLSTRIGLCIELDGPRHQTHSQTKRRDRFIETSLATARIPLLRQPVQDWS